VIGNYLSSYAISVFSPEPLHYNRKSFIRLRIRNLPLTQQKKSFENRFLTVSPSCAVEQNTDHHKRIVHPNRINSQSEYTDATLPVNWGLRCTKTKINFVWFWLWYIFNFNFFKSEVRNYTTKNGCRYSFLFIKSTNNINIV